MKYIKQEPIDRGSCHYDSSPLALADQGFESAFYSVTVQFQSNKMATNEPEEAVKILDDLLARRTSPEQAAAETARFYNPRLAEGRTYLGIWHILCGHILDHGGDAPTRSLLIGFLDHLAQQPDVVDHQGRVVRETPPKGVYWKDLPMFALTFREVYDGEYHKSEQLETAKFD